MAPEGLLRSSPRTAAPSLITFRRLEPNGHTGPQVTVMGCLTASDHCCGQGIPATGVLQQHRPAQALFAGFRTRPRPRAIYSDSVGSDGNEPCVRYMSANRRRTGDDTLHRCLQAPRERVRHTGATWQAPTVRIWAPLCCKVTLQCSWR